MYLHAAVLLARVFFLTQLFPLAVQSESLPNHPIDVDFRESATDESHFDPARPTLNIPTPSAEETRPAKPSRILQRQWSVPEYRYPQSDKNRGRWRALSDKMSRLRQKSIKGLTPKKKPIPSFSRLLGPISRLFKAFRRALSKIYQSVSKKVFSSKELTLRQKNALLHPDLSGVKDSFLKILLEKCAHDKEGCKKLITNRLEQLMRKRKMNFRMGFNSLLAFSYLSEQHTFCKVQLRWALFDLQNRFLFSKDSNPRLLEAVRLVLKDKVLASPFGSPRAAIPQIFWDTPWGPHIIFPQNGIYQHLMAKASRQYIEFWLKSDEVIAPYFETLKSDGTSKPEAEKAIERVKQMAMNRSLETGAKTKVGALVLLRYFYDKPMWNHNSKRAHDADIYKLALSALVDLLDVKASQVSEHPNRFFLPALIEADMCPFIFPNDATLTRSNTNPGLHRNTNSADIFTTNPGLHRNTNSADILI